MKTEEDNLMEDHAVPVMPNVADVCAMCGKSLSEVRGSRIVAAHFRGIDITTDPDQGYPWAEVKKLTLAGKNDGLILVLGGAGWEDNAVTRAVTQANDGFRPWMCQVCVGKVCDTCGSPMTFPFGTDRLDDDGEVSHVPILPTAPGCINPTCGKHLQ